MAFEKGNEMIADVIGHNCRKETVLPLVVPNLLLADDCLPIEQEEIHGCLVDEIEMTDVGVHDLILEVVLGPSLHLRKQM